MMREPGDAATSLKREVLPPGRTSSGLGVIIVAAATMFLAVASSAFVLQARMRAPCPYQRQAPTPVQLDADVLSAEVGENVECGSVLEVRDGDVLYIVHTPPCQ